MAHKPSVDVASLLKNCSHAVEASCPALHMLNRRILAKRVHLGFALLLQPGPAVDEKNAQLGKRVHHVAEFLQPEGIPIEGGSKSVSGIPHVADGHSDVARMRQDTMQPARPLMYLG
jgi:hypothetical protein